MNEVPFLSNIKKSIYHKENISEYKLRKYLLLFRDVAD